MDLQNKSITQLGEMLEELEKEWQRDTDELKRINESLERSNKRSKVRQQQIRMIKDELRSRNPV